MTKDAKKFQKKFQNFYCKKCDYVTSRESQYERHCTTLKHQKDDKECQKVPKSSERFVCDCGHSYKFRQGLSKHKKTCNTQNITLPSENIPINVVELFKQQIQENKEMKYFMLEQQRQLMEQNKQIIELSKDKSYHITNNNCHTTNKFNMKIFLNEQCKDALNLVEFVNSLHLKLTDLENTARVGYVEGISKIFVKGLQELDVYKRPVHCSDLKREILYVKDEDKWEKEDDDNTKIKNAIQQITHKNIKQITNWVEQNPKCKDVTSKQNEQYMRLISNCMMGENEEEQNANVNKIITRVAKEVIISK